MGGVSARGGSSAEGGFTTIEGVPPAGERMGEVENKVVDEVEGTVGDGGVDSGDEE